VSKESKKEKKEKKKDKARDKGNGAGRGRLIALEGTHGTELAEAAGELLRKLAGKNKLVGVSRWDASNTFFELRLVKGPFMAPSLRTLLLLYAADLSFRLRWEIEPALAEGRTVIAAPYVETAIAFGTAVGMQREWLVDVFRFAPKADAVFRIKEKRKRWHDKLKAGDGLLEACGVLLAASGRAIDIEKVRGKCLDYLEHQEEREEVSELKKKAVAAVV
jgi:hypothetical protein